MISSFPKTVISTLVLLSLAAGMLPAQQTVPFKYDGRDGSVRVQFLVYAEGVEAGAPDLEGVALAEHAVINLSDYRGVALIVRLTDLTLERRRDNDRYYLEVPELLVNFGRGLQRRPLPGGRLVLVGAGSEIEGGRERADIRFEADRTINQKIKHQVAFGFNVKRVSDGGVVTHIRSVKADYTLLPPRKKRPAAPAARSRPDPLENARREYESLAALPDEKERARAAAAYLERWRRRGAATAELEALLRQAETHLSPAPAAARATSEAAAPLPSLTSKAVLPETDAPAAELPPPPAAVQPSRAPAAVDPETARQEEQAWRNARALNTREAYEKYLLAYGEAARYGAVARKKTAPFDVVIQSSNEKDSQGMAFQVSIAGSEGKTPSVRVVEGREYLDESHLQIDSSSLVARLRSPGKAILELSVIGSPWKKTTLTLDASPTPLRGAFEPVENGQLRISGLQGGAPPYYLEVLDLDQQRRVVNIRELGEEEAYTIQLSDYLKKSGTYKLRITDQSRTAMAKLESAPIDYQQPPLLPRSWLYGLGALLLVVVLAYYARQESRKKQELEQTRAYMRRLKSEVHDKQQTTT